MQKNNNKKGHGRIVQLFFVQFIPFDFALPCYLSLQAIFLVRLETTQQNSNSQLEALRYKFSSQLSSYPHQILSNGSIYSTAPPSGVIGRSQVGIGIYDVPRLLQVMCFK